MSMAAKYEIIDLDRVDENKPIQVSMPFSEMCIVIRRLTKWQAIEFVFGALRWQHFETKSPYLKEAHNRRKFYRTLFNKTRDQLEKILLSKLYLEGTITRT